MERNDTIMGLASGRHERVLAFCPLDINRSLQNWEEKYLAPESKAACEKFRAQNVDKVRGSLANTNYINRLFTLSNQGL